MIEREFQVDGSPLVKIAIRSGRVVVEPGEAGVVRISVDTGDPTFEVRRRGDAIVAWGERGGRAYVAASVPPMTEMDISTASGDVSVGTPLSRLDASTASGDVHFDSVVRLQAKTSSGNIRGSQVDGEARCVTASGDIRIAQLLDRADLSTASGDLIVDRCAGSISCATVSGDVAINEMIGPTINVKSMSGLVYIGVLPGSRLDLDANSLSGRIKLPSPGSGTEPPQREISAKIRLVSGDLRIERVK